MLFAVAIILIGFVFLMKNLGIITGPAWDIIWPILLIALGLSILLKPKWGWSGMREERFIKFHHEDDDSKNK